MIGKTNAQVGGGVKTQYPNILSSSLILCCDSSTPWFLINYYDASKGMFAYASCEGMTYYTVMHQVNTLYPIIVQTTCTYEASTSSNLELVMRGNNEYGNPIYVFRPTTGEDGYNNGNFEINFYK